MSQVNPYRSGCSVCIRWDVSLTPLLVCRIFAGCFFRRNPSWSYHILPVVEEILWKLFSSRKIFTPWYRM